MYWWRNKAIDFVNNGIANLNALHNCTDRTNYNFGQLFTILVADPFVGLIQQSALQTMIVCLCL